MAVSITMSIAHSISCQITVDCDCSMPAWLLLLLLVPGPSLCSLAEWDLWPLVTPVLGPLSPACRDASTAYLTLLQVQYSAVQCQCSTLQYSALRATRVQ